MSSSCRAWQSRKKTGRKLGRTLIDLGFIDEDKLLQVLSQHFKIPFIQLRQYQLNVDLVKLLPETLSRRFRAIVLSEKSDGLIIGMSDPMDILRSMKSDGH